MNKSLIYTVSAGIIGLMMVVSPVRAASGKDVREAKQNLIEVRRDFREDFREKVASRVGSIKALFKSRMSIISGKITAINGSTLTVEKDGKSYSVVTGIFDTCTTKFRRRFWGSSSLSEYAVGHMVNVFGRFKDDTKTTVEACVIRDISIQKRFGAFIGQVISLSADGWVMTTVSDKRANQTITITSTTKFVNRKEETISKSDIKIGDRVRVKGMWDRTVNTVSEVTHVKNYSLPVRAIGTVTPTQTITPTATVKPTVTVTPTVTPTP